MQVGNYQDYRIFLRDELENRMRGNSRYSMRAFARDLQIAPQIMSQVLKGKKGISSSKAAQLSEKLGLSPKEAIYFGDLVTLAHARSESARKIAELRISRSKSGKSFDLLQEDTFKVISDWHHYAIVELTRLKNFDVCPESIAKALGIQVHEARQAITRLIKIGLLEETGGSLRSTKTDFATKQDAPSAAVRKFTKQILEKGASALENQKIPDRDFGTMTMAISKSKLPEAKQLIRAFRRDLAALLEQGSRDDVYVFSTQLFSLTSSSGKELTKNEK